MKHGLNDDFVQSNTSYNKKKWTLRGMHYQKSPYAESKLVRCIRGAIFDVIIDLRPQSATFKKWFGLELSESNKRQLYVPEGFAHGYQTLTDRTEVCYHVSQYYHPQSEEGVRYNDPAFEIDWPNSEDVIISDKDKLYKDFLL